MPRLLISDEYPNGHDLGAILEGIRREVLKASSRMTHNGNPETRFLMGSVLDCNMKVMDLLNRAKALVEDMAGLPARKQLAVVPLRTSGRVDSGRSANRLRPQTTVLSPVVCPPSSRDA